MTDFLDKDRDDLSLPTEEQLDHLPLTFGMHRGKTPEQVADTLGKRGQEYLVWAYENVGNYNVCSAALYRDCGGKHSRAVRKSKKPVQVPDNKRTPPPSTGRPIARTDSFDDFDDDVPF